MSTTEYDTSAENDDSSVQKSTLFWFHKTRGTLKRFVPIGAICYTLKEHASELCHDRRRSMKPEPSIGNPTDKARHPLELLEYNLGFPSQLGRLALV